MHSVRWGHKRHLALCKGPVKLKNRMIRGRSLLLEAVGVSAYAILCRGGSIVQIRPDDHSLSATEQRTFAVLGARMPCAL